MPAWCWDKMVPKFRVEMQSVPAPGRTFYAGHVVVHADDEAEAREEALRRVEPVHGHRDFRVTGIRIVG